MLSLVPCTHYYLAVEYRAACVVAMCKHRHCRKRFDISHEQWTALKAEDRALDKPVRA